jgi:23S rRNA pseudouridine2604 synthase
LTTIKIIKKPNDASIAIKTPVRRADPSKRDRRQAPPKTVAKEEDAQAYSKDKVDSSVRGNDAFDVGGRTNMAKENRPTGPTKTSDNARQRNHRFDGKAHVKPFAEQSVDKTEENRSLRSTLRAKPESEPKQHKPAGVDTRITPRPDKNEPQYRQAPRRGGKVRDGYDAVATPRYGAAAKAAYKSSPVNLDMPRLSKVMAERGICSRREADEWIVNGWVKVDGVIMETLGTRIKPDAEIVISGYAYEQQAEQVTILLHKPVGYVSGQAEDGYQPAIVLVHPDNEWMDDPDLNDFNAKEFQRGFLHGLAPAGRLDIDSTGLLVLTQDGRIARHLIGEDSSVEKEYLVRVEGTLSDANLQRLNHGLSLDGEKLKPAKVSWQNEDQLRFVLREGKKRQIRRMCEMVGLFVVGLKRVRIGSVNLGKLPQGQWRYLRENERF